MDPDEVLKRMRELQDKIERSDQTSPTLYGNALDLAQAVNEMDEWLSRGGFLPIDWSARV